MKRYQIQFKGQVQGVGFRYITRKLAIDFTCTGWVKNQSDGSVLMEIQGEENNINNVLKHLNEVSHIIIEDSRKYTIEVKENEQYFQIKY